MRAAAARLKAAVQAADPGEMDLACDDIVASGANSTLVPAMRQRAAALRVEQARTLAKRHVECDAPGNPPVTPSTEESSARGGDKIPPPVPHFRPSDQWVPRGRTTV